MLLSVCCCGKTLLFSATVLDRGFNYLGVFLPLIMNISVIHIASLVFSKRQLETERYDQTK